MKPDFQKFLTRKYSVLMDDIIVRSWADKKRYFKLTGVKEYVKNIEIIDGAFCFDMNWMDEIYKKYSRKKPEFFWRFCREGIARGEKIRKFARNLDLNKNKKELVNDFWKSLDLLGDLMVFIPQTHPLAKIVEDKVRSILKTKNIEAGKFEDILLELTRPKKLNSPVLEQIDLYKIRKNANKPNFDLDKALNAHHKKYSFLGYREPFSRGYDVSFFKSRLKEEEPANKKPAIKLIFTKEEKEWVELMREMVFFRNYRTEKMCEAFYYLEPFWNKIGEFYNLPENELAHYQISEAKKLFDKKIKTEIKNRKAAHGYLVHDDKVKLITGLELEKKIRFYNTVKSGVKEIKGSTACGGSVKGIVKVVMSSKEQDKVKQGEILVTGMTTPDFIPSMRRASAFITDEGGITCHAAIVAREMNKPCVIGTKIATKILKDGDLVEVDASKGLIKILLTFAN